MIATKAVPAHYDSKPHFTFRYASRALFVEGFTDLGSFLKAARPWIRQLAVVFINKRRVPANISVDDLVQVGMFTVFKDGLYDKFNPEDGSRGISFAEYAKLRIIGSFNDELRSQDHLSRQDRANLKLYKKLLDSGRCVPSELRKTVAHLFGVEVLPLEEGVYPGADEVVHFAGVANLIEMELSDEGSLLNPQQKNVLASILEGNGGVVLAHRLGVTDSRVCQIKMRALEKLSNKYDLGLFERSPKPRKKRPRNGEESVDVNF